jgi:hypothetical protein
VSKRGSLGLEQGLNLDEEKVGNLDVEGEWVEDKVLVVPLKPSMDMSLMLDMIQMLEYCTKQSKIDYQI